MSKKKLILPGGPVSETDSYQIFLLYNGLMNKMDWKDPEHLELWEEWQRKVRIFRPWKPMPISPSNAGFNHY